MALNLVHSQGGTDGGTASQTPALTVTTTGSATGTGLILIINNGTGGGARTISSVTDDKSNTWSQAVTKNGVGVTNLITDIWYVDPSTYVSAVTTVTVHFNTGTTFYNWFFYEVSGGASSWLDQIGSGNSSGSTAPTASTPTLSQAAEFAVGGIAYLDVRTLSGLTSGWNADTKEDSTSIAIALQPANQITAATTALTYAGTLSSSGTWQDVIATFKGAAAASIQSGTPFGQLGQSQMTQLLGY